MKTRTLVSAVAAVMLTACASTPPTSAYAPIAAPPSVVTASIPSWYVKQPESTNEAIYVAGAAISRDLSMSGEKALLDAQSNLADKLAAEISTLTKSYKRDVGEEFMQSTESIARKVAPRVKVIGYTVTERVIQAEGGGYRTYVLVKFPLGATNQLMQSYLNNKTFKGTQAQAERELTAAERRN